MLLGLSCWGVAITWPNSNNDAQHDDQCDPGAFLIAFVCATFVLCTVALRIGVLVANDGVVYVDSQKRDQVLASIVYLEKTRVESMQRYAEIAEATRLSKLIAEVAVPETWSIGLAIYSRENLVKTIRIVSFWDGFTTDGISGGRHVEFVW